MLSQAFSVIIDHGISASGHDKEVVYDLNAICKIFFSQLMPTVKLSVPKGYVTHMAMHTVTHTSNVSLSRQ